MAAPFVREILEAFCTGRIGACEAAKQLQVGKTRFHQLKASYLAARTAGHADDWQPGCSGGDHTGEWSQAAVDLVTKLLKLRPPASYGLCASELHRRLGMQVHPAGMRRFAISRGLQHDDAPVRRQGAGLRRWQCDKIGAIWQLDATPHHWFGPDLPNFPMLNMLDDCSRLQTGSKIYQNENLMAYLDFLPESFSRHGLPLTLYTDYHSLFFTHTPDALTTIGHALRFYGVTLRFAPTPQAKGKIERNHLFWQGRLPVLLAEQGLRSPLDANPLVEQLRLHNNSHHVHRELHMTASQAWDLALREGRSALRPAPKCPWWPYVWSVRSSVLVASDHTVPAGSLRLRIPAKPGSRVVRCAHPNGSLTFLHAKPEHGAMPLVLLRLES